MRVSAVVICWLATLPSAHAQLSVPDDGLAYPSRAGAVRPTGRSVHAVTWDAQRWQLPPHPGSPEGTDDFGRQLITHTVEVAVPLDALMLEVNLTGIIQWLLPGASDSMVTLTTGNPEVGALFVDAPAPEVRYQLGGAVSLPLSTTTLVDGANPPPSGVRPLFPMLPLDNLLRLRSLGWNAHRSLPETVGLVARGHIEVDPHPNLAVALDGDVPLTITFDGVVDVRPQAALTIAARVDEYSLLGVRTEVVTNLPMTDYTTRDANVLLEPFARIAWSTNTDRPIFYARLALRAPLGPAFKFVTEAPVGWLGGGIALGALY